MNERIRVPQVLLIDQNGEKVGLISTEQARQRAVQAELDLVEVAPNARPPVCRIMDYGKFLFEQQKKERVTKSKRTHANDTKEVRLRPNTGLGDMEIKARNARKFFEEGYKVGIQLQFRGRERAHPEVAMDKIKIFAEMLSDIAKVERPPRMEGRRMNATMAPLPNAAKKVDKESKPTPETPETADADSDS